MTSRHGFEKKLPNNILPCLLSLDPSSSKPCRNPRKNIKMPPEPKPYGEIYVITCLLMGKLYVGQTIRGAERRWKEHKSGSSRSNHYINHALKLHGYENFTLKVIDTASTPDELNLKEQHWIKTLGSLVPNGYNLTTGGDSTKQSPESIEKSRLAKIGSKRTEETKAKMRAAWQRSPDRRKKSPETIEKLRQTHLGRKCTEETRAKMKAAIRPPRSLEAIEKTRQANLGKKRTPEARARMSVRAKARPPFSPEHIEELRQSHLGKTHTLEAKTRMSEAAKARWAARKAGNNL
jgi:group I intron endonuclease